MLYGGELPQDEVGYGRYSDYIDPSLALIARVAEKRLGVHYDGFQVGAAGVFSVENRLDIAVGANKSPYEGAAKSCAEQSVLRYGDRLFGKYGSAVVMRCLYVVSPDNPEKIEGINGLPAETLDPCANCRERLYEHPAIDNLNMPVVSLVDSGRTFDTNTPEELRGKYGRVVPPKVSRDLILGSLAV